MTASYTRDSNTRLSVGRFNNAEKYTMRLFSAIHLSIYSLTKTKQSKTREKASRSTLYRGKKVGGTAPLQIYVVSFPFLHRALSLPYAGALPLLALPYFALLLMVGPEATLLHTTTR